MSIGQNIYLARKNKNMSQEQIANALNVSRQCVSLWETDQTIPTMDNLNSICDLLEVSLDVLAGRQPFVNPSDSKAEEAVRIENQKKERRYKIGRKFALTSFILGLVAIVTSLIPGIGFVVPVLAIVFSIISKTYGERKLFPYGLSLGIVFLFANIVYMIMYVDGTSLFN